MVKSTKILLRSSWQTINIGDIAHTPGVMALIEKKFPEAQVILWASGNITKEIEDMEKKRFPSLKIVKGTIGDNGKASNKDLQDAIDWCDMLLHGSGPSLVATEDVRDFVKYFNKPFGVFGITYSGANSADRELMSKAKFIFFRDSYSLKKAIKDGITSPIMEFGPDGAFATDLRNDEKALGFMNKNNLEDGKFVCVIPRYRITPYWLKKDNPKDEPKFARNNAMKEHDHKELLDAVIKIARETEYKVLVCPEDVTQMAIGKEMIIDKLPSDVKDKVVWREDFWLPDEAISVYVRSIGLFGNEMHSPIMCIGNGIPAIVCRWGEQTTKGYMWEDIGLGQWLFNLDNDNEMNGIVPAVMDMVNNREHARQMVQLAQGNLVKYQNRMIEVLKNTLN